MARSLDVQGSWKEQAVSSSGGPAVTVLLLVVLLCLAPLGAVAQVFECLNTNTNHRVVTNTPKLAYFRDCKSLSLKEASVTYVPSESFGRGITKREKREKKGSVSAATTTPSATPTPQLASLPAALQYEVADRTLDFGGAGCDLSGKVESVSGPACRAELRVYHQGAHSQFEISVATYNATAQIHEGTFTRTLRGACGKDFTIEILSCLPSSSDAPGY